jgi:hypothetical protein
MTQIHGADGLHIDAQHPFPVTDSWEALLAEGKVFFVTETSVVGAAVTKYYRLKAPAGPTRCRLYAVLYSTVTGHVFLEENPTITVAGGALTPVNLNRNSATVPTLDVEEDPTVTVDGDVLSEADTGPAGGDLAPLAPFELKQSEDTVIRYVDAGAGSTVRMAAIWSEVG